MTIARRNIAKLVATTMTGVALGLTTQAVAAADATDDAFIVKVTNDALYFSSRNEVILAGQRVCAAFSAGGTPAQVHEAIQHKSRFTPRQTAIFMADAVQAYCPKYASQFVS
jgi:Protein of unknown function (DUF732)